MSVPPPSSPPPAAGGAPPHELVLALEASGDRRKARPGGHDRITLSTAGVAIEHGRVLQAPLTLPLAAVKVAIVEPGPAKQPGAYGRFPVLRRLGPSAVIPRSEGIEGWLWTSTGGTALVLAKPLDEAQVRSAFDPEFVTALAARSPLGSPTVHGLLFRAADTLAAEQGFRRWGFQSVLTDKEVPPTLRRHLPTDRPADPVVRGGGGDPRATTSVAPPGMS